MRYVVHGAGAVGGVIGARLHAAGLPVVLIARGAHLDALRADGLRLREPGGERTLRVPVAGTPQEAGVDADDVVLLCVKGQDTDAALDDLLAATGGDAPTIACVQNGVENERRALRRAARVLGVYVYLPAQHLVPGVVEVASGPVPGALHVGRVPAGPDAGAQALSAALRRAGFVSEALEDVMPMKREKLLRNVGNAIDALLEASADADGLTARARAEGAAVFAAAGLPVASDAQVAALRTGVTRHPADAGVARGGSSTWQDLRRGKPRTESDLLNGEVVLLGRLHGVPVPVNAGLQRAVQQAARDGRAPGSLSLAELEAFCG